MSDRYLSVDLPFLIFVNLPDDKGRIRWLITSRAFGNLGNILIDFSQVACDSARKGGCPPYYNMPGPARELFYHFGIASQYKDVPRHPFTFLDGDATYPKEFGPLWVVLGGFKVVISLIPARKTSSSSVSLIGHR